METSRELERARRAELARWLCMLFGILLVLYQIHLALVVPGPDRVYVGVVSLLAIVALGRGMALANQGNGSWAGVLCAAAAAATLLVGERLVGVQPTVGLLGPIVLAVIADRQRLQQILLNLVGNSAKFTSDGRIYLLAVEDEGRAAVVVGDTGKGMTHEELKRAFEKFGQAGDPAVPEGGTGLGLPIALELTAAMGGHLVATSEPGRGTEIMLRLPMQQPARASLLAPSRGRETRRTQGLQ